MPHIQGSRLHLRCSRTIMIRNLQTVVAFLVLWVGVSYVCALLLFPFWFAANMAMR